MDKVCETCGEEFITKKSSRRFCSLECHYESMRGRPSWNAGTAKGWLDERGYRWIYVTEDGQRRARREHRVLMEQYLGRRLEPWEDVHHINGDKSDNTEGNLQLIAHDEHTIAEHVGAKRPEAANKAIQTFAQMREEIHHLRRVNADLLEAAKWGRDLLKRLEPALTEDNPVYGSLVASIAKAEGRT